MTWRPGFDKPGRVNADLPVSKAPFERRTAHGRSRRRLDPPGRRRQGRRGEAHRRVLRQRAGPARQPDLGCRRAAPGSFEAGLGRGRLGSRPGPGPRGRCRGRSRPDVRRRGDQFVRRARGAAHGPAGSCRRGLQGPGPAGHGRCRERPPADEGLCRGRALGRDQGRDRQAVQGDPAHRHRRQRPWPPSAVGRPAPGQAEHRPALRRERGRRRVRPDDGRHGSRRDPGHRRVQDLHDAGDPGQCRGGARLAGRGVGRERRQPASGRHLDRARQDRRLRRAGRAGVRLLGLGWRALFAVVVGEPVGRRRGRLGRLPGLPGRRRGHGRALPHRVAGEERSGAGRPGPDLQPQRPGPPGPLGRPLFAPPAPPGLVPPAAGDGEQR